MNIVFLGLFESNNVINFLVTMQWGVVGGRQEGPQYEPVARRRPCQFYTLDPPRAKSTQITLKLLFLGKVVIIFLGHKSACFLSQ